MKTYILGDTHGEFYICLEILIKAGLVSENGHWKKKNKSVLIQIGDVIDRGKWSIETYSLFKNLQKEALSEGGKVIRLLGNHELSYIGGPSIPREDAGVFLTDDIKKEVSDNKIIAACKVEDWIVVHGGVMPRLSAGKDLQELVEDLNSRLTSAVNHNDYSDEIFSAGYSRGGRGEPGIFWADYESDLLPVEEFLIKQIVGHTPPFNRAPIITMSKGGKIINVDVGICSLYGGHKGILLCENNGFSSIAL